MTKTYLLRLSLWCHRILSFSLYCLYHLWVVWINTLHGDLRAGNCLLPTRTWSLIAIQVPRVQHHKYKNVCTPTKHKKDAIRRLERTKFSHWRDDGRRTAVLLLGLKLRCLHRTSHVWKDQSSHVREPRTVLDSGFHARNSFRIPGNYSRSMSVELGFRIPIFSGIPNPGFRFLGQNFRGFRIPNAKICRILEFITWGETMPYSVSKTVTI